ncbi:MAG TPA: hypothetical protein VLJ57_16945 [Burkholderiaceae bacterium]|nr:hypothetical protein [Burkholderiaceae bacterium]
MKHSKKKEEKQKTKTKKASSPRLGQACNCRHRMRVGTPLSGFDRHALAVERVPVRRPSLAMGELMQTLCQLHLY